jgi:two-component system, cell cycle sensor histidine kinase and response regulator CckA
METSHILVVDDEELLRDFMRDSLETAGYVVLTATNGEEALQLSRAFPTTIHLMVSDVIMPKLGGVALRERILQERPAIKVLLVSGTVEQPLQGVEFLRKPFQAETLRNHVRRLLLDAQAQRQSGGPDG